MKVRFKWLGSFLRKIHRSQEPIMGSCRSCIGDYRRHGEVVSMSHNTDTIPGTSEDAPTSHQTHTQHVFKIRFQNILRSSHININYSSNGYYKLLSSYSMKTTKWCSLSLTTFIDVTAEGEAAGV